MEKSGEDNKFLREWYLTMLEERIESVVRFTDKELLKNDKYILELKKIKPVLEKIIKGIKKEFYLIEQKSSEDNK